MSPDPIPPDPAALVLTFLESVGRRSEAELYVKLFRELPRESFGMIAAEAEAVRHAQLSLIQQLQFLSALGLVAPVVIGLFHPTAMRGEAQALQEGLQRLGLDSRVLSASGDDLAVQLQRLLRQQVIPLVQFDQDCGGLEARFELLGGWLEVLKSKKLVVLRSKGGLGPHGRDRLIRLPGDQVLSARVSGLSVINLRSDLEPIRQSALLGPEELALLDGLAALVQAGGDRGFMASVASPLGLIRELFTVKGAGTLIKPGRLITRFDDFASIDLVRLGGLLESAFARSLAPDFFERRPLAIFLEQEYRGAVVLEPGEVAPFLTKFVVGRIAQGEGIARDLWQRVVGDLPAFYWRARPDNAISAWYSQLCDGFTRTEHWTVYWRGIEPERIPDCVADAIERPEDFQAS